MLAVFLSLAPVEAAPLAGASAAAPPIHSYTPAGALATLARERGVAVAGITLEDLDRPPAASDAVTLFVVIEESERQRQWLIQLRGPRASKPVPSGGRPRDDVFYGMDGRAIRFTEQVETYEILALGPWDSTRPEAGIAHRTLRVAMNAAFLAEPIDRAAGFIYRTGRARLEGRLGQDEWFTVLPTPPIPPDAAARARFVDVAGLTDADERALAAMVPALNEFARVIATTPGLKEVLFAIVEKPSAWSLLSRLGRIQTDIRFNSGEVIPSGEPPLGFAGIGPCYIVPFSFAINGAPGLECSMLVAQARPPARMCGGIFALVATAPNRPQTRLIARVLATSSKIDVPGPDAPARAH